MITLVYFIIGLLVGILSISPVTFYLFRINRAQAEELRVLAQRYNMETLEELPDPNLTRDNINAIKVSNTSKGKTAEKIKEDYWNMISNGEILEGSDLDNLSDGLPY